MKPLSDRLIGSDALRHLFHLEEGIEYRRGCGYCEMTCAKTTKNESQIWYREAQESGVAEVRLGRSIRHSGKPVPSYLKGVSV